MTTIMDLSFQILLLILGSCILCLKVSSGKTVKGQIIPQRMLGNTVRGFYKYWTTIASYISEGKIILFTKITICSPYIVDEQIF